MSRFRRVSEQTTPDYVNKMFDNDYQGDPYARLKETSADRRMKIAQNSKNYKMSQKDTPHDWERETEQEAYQDFEFPKNDQDLEERFLGANNRVVRRADNAIDAPYSARDTENLLPLFTPEQYMNAMLRGASIFDPNMEDIAQAFNESQAADGLTRNETRELAKQSSREGWEKAAMNDIGRSKYSTSRANPFVRTSQEYTGESSFGLVDITSLDERDQQRLKMRANRRSESAEIKRSGQRIARHKDWEDSISPNAGTMQDYYAAYGIDSVDLMID